MELVVMIMEMDGGGRRNARHRRVGVEQEGAVM